MLLKLRFVADSIPSALTILFNDLPTKCPHGSTFDEVLKRLDLARIGSKRTAHPWHNLKDLLMIIPCLIRKWIVRKRICGLHRESRSVDGLTLARHALDRFGLLNIQTQRKTMPT